MRTALVYVLHNARRHKAIAAGLDAFSTAWWFDGWRGGAPPARAPIKRPFDRGAITVRSGKGDKDRLTVLPTFVTAELRTHLERIHRQHQGDLAQGVGSVELPGALARKLPSAARELPWQWVFPATRHYRDRI